MKKIIFLVLLVATIIPFSVFAADTFVEDNLAVIDEYMHQSEAFSNILDAIYQDHPKYTKERIGLLIATAYYEVRKTRPSVGIYEVAEGIKRFASDNIGLELKDLVVSYIKSQNQ